MAKPLTQEDQIKKDVSEKMAQYAAMPRETLLKEYMRLTGNEAHPRFSRNWLERACARIYQTTTWISKLGYLPGDIAIADLRFWSSNKVHFVKSEKRIPKEGSKKKGKNISTGASCPVIEERGNVKTGGPATLTAVDVKNLLIGAVEDIQFEPDTSLYILEAYQWLLKKGDATDFADVAKWCKSHKQKPDPAYVYLELRSQNAVRFKLRKPDGSLVDVESRIVTESTDEEADVLTCSAKAESADEIERDETFYKEGKKLQVP